MQRLSTNVCFMVIYCIEMQSPTKEPIVKVGATRDWNKRHKALRAKGHHRLKSSGKFKIWDADRIWHRENEIKKMLQPYLVWGSECFNIDVALVVSLIDFYVTWPAKPNRRRDISRLETRIRNSLSPVRTGVPGRPRTFDPTQEQWDKVKQMWRSKEFVLSHRMALIENIMGRPIAPHLVRDRLKVEND